MMLTQKLFNQFPASENPLSSDVFFIQGDKGNYIFDVGASTDAVSFLNGIDDKIVILSHFHQDHTANIKNIQYKKVYGSKFTCSHINGGEVLSEAYTLEQELYVIPVTTCHSKGSLTLKIADSYLLVGDLLCGCQTKIGYGYNAGMLLSTIRELKAIETSYIIPSHTGKILTKKEAISNLEAIYRKRDGNEPYIVVDSR